MKNSILYANNKKLIIHVDHELNYNNIKEITSIKNIQELNIGHAIISKTIFIGLKNEIQNMKKLIKESSSK